MIKITNEGRHPIVIKAFNNEMGKFTSVDCGVHKIVLGPGETSDSLSTYDPYDIRITQPRKIVDASVPDEQSNFENILNEANEVTQEVVYQEAA